MAETDGARGARGADARAGGRTRRTTAPERQASTSASASILGVLTAFEVWLSYSGIRRRAADLALIMASITKFVMVVAYFMHLKYDDWRYARFFLMGIAGAATLYLIVLIIFGRSSAD